MRVHWCLACHNGHHAVSDGVERRSKVNRSLELEERVRIAVELSEAVRATLEGGIRHRHPEYTTELFSSGQLRYKAMNAKTTDISYEKDFYAWAIHNAALLKQGRIAEIDIKNIAEELESMGKRDKRQIVNRSIVLLVHLLKWEFQPENRSRGWKGSIIEQRRRLIQLLEDSPSLNNELDNQLNYAYAEALKQASIETGLDPSVFPNQCPYSKAQLLDDEFYPAEK